MSYFFEHKEYLFFLIFTTCFYIISSEDSLINYIKNDDGIYELNSYYIITKISWTFNGNNPDSYLLGIFEASNDTFFSDSLPIAMIKEDNININSIINEITVNIPNSYKYIRFISLISNGVVIDPINIYGHVFSEGEDLSEKEIYRPTNLPLMIINTENSVEPKSKEVLQ